MDQMNLPVGGAAAAMEDLLALVEMAVDGAIQAGMPLRMASITVEGLDGDGAVTVSGVSADGQKFTAEVDLSEGMPEEEEEAPPADAPPPPPADMAVAS